MLWDTIDKEERPRLIDVLEGRDYLTSLFLTHGVFVGGLNIVGEYGKLRSPNPNPNPSRNPIPNPNQEHDSVTITAPQCPSNAGIPG